MSKKIIFISDFYYPSFVGGAELNDYSLICRFVNDAKKEIWKFKSADITPSFLKNHQEHNFIISNFVGLSTTCREYLSANCSYIIYEHDHKYLKKRNPIFYKNFVAPPKDLANYDFYKNAKLVVCLTQLAVDVIKRNTGLDNIEKIGASVWRDQDLDYLNEIRKTEKNDCYAIMDSDNPIKKREHCIQYCEKNNLKYELIKDPNNKQFLKKLNDYKGLIFMTGHLETCCRIIVEAKMLGLQVITQKNLIGAASEEWFFLNGEQLVEKIREISKASTEKFQWRKS